MILFFFVDVTLDFEKKKKPKTLVSYPAFLLAANSLKKLCAS